MTVRQPYSIELVTTPTLFKAIEATADLIETKNGVLPPAGTDGFRRTLRWRRDITQFALETCQRAGLSLLPIDAAQDLLEERRQRHLAYKRRLKARQIERSKAAA